MIRSNTELLSSHWKEIEHYSSGINRHRITSRNIVVAIQKARERQIARRWRFNLAARIAHFYDLIFGPVRACSVCRSRPAGHPTLPGWPLCKECSADVLKKPLLVERSNGRAKHASD